MAQRCAATSSVRNVTPVKPWLANTFSSTETWPSIIVMAWLACWVTEPAANNFPRLPVRENEPVIAWLTRFDDEAAQLRHAALLRASGCLERAEWRAHLSGDAEQLRLAPTPRSALRRRHPLEG